MVIYLPDYKKKNIKKHRKNAKNIITDDVVMQRSRVAKTADNTQKSDLKNPQKKRINVIKGNKIRNRNKRLAAFGICVLLIMALSVVSLMTPTGIIEIVENNSASIKFGSNYPVKLSGGSLINVTPQGNHLFLVSTTNFECYNNNGKNIFSYQHGYQSPVVSVSEARTLLYDQSGKNYSIYNLNRELATNTTDNEILAATICRDGSYAIATLSDSYASQVTVYNKNSKKVYEWFCSDYIINSVLLSPNGETLAVSVISAADGSFISKVYILQFDSATPKALYEYNGLILGLTKCGNSGFTCISENFADFFTWKRFKSNTFSTGDNILISRNYKSNILLVTGRPANKNENTVTVFDAFGNAKHSFVFNGIVDSLEYKSNYVYILSENNIYHYTVNGELVAKGTCEFGTRFILPISPKEAAAVTDNNIQKIIF